MVPESILQAIATAVFTLPGGQLKHASFTNALCRGLNFGGSIPLQRWAQTTYDSANYGNLFCGPLSLEACAWGMSVLEAQSVDPQQLLLLEIGYSAFSHATSADS